MDKIQIANILLTRRCNLKCSYCHLVKDNEKVPAYPTIKEFYERELKPSDWIERFKSILLNNPDCFFVIYGGEPFLYEDISEVLKWCNDNKVNYTVISNNMPALQERIKRVCDEIGGFRGFTSSVDPILSCGNELNDRYKKSKAGFERLCEIKRSGMAEDVVAEITVDGQFYSYLYDTVKLLSENGIYSSITAIDDKKSDLYDFASFDVSTSSMLPRIDAVKDQFDKIQNDKSLLVHIPELLTYLYESLPSGMMCSIPSDIHNVTIDADGKYRLCLRIRGTSTPSVFRFRVLGSKGIMGPEFRQAIKEDYNNFCLGCNWTCMMMSGMFSKSIVDH